MSSKIEYQQLDLDYVDDLDDPNTHKEKAAIFSELWLWVEKNVYRTNRLKGWLTKERKDGEHIALIHSELSECLEALRKGNPVCPRKMPDGKRLDISHAEEEIADVIIRLMDLSFNKKWNIPKALFLKMEYNKTRPYRHGGKKF